jgi:hypothetical protein
MKKVMIMTALLLIGCQKEEVNPITYPVNPEEVIQGDWTIEVQQEWEGTKLIEITQPNKPIELHVGTVILDNQKGRYILNNKSLKLDLDNTGIYELGCCIYELTDSTARIKVPNGSTNNYFMWFLKK